MADAWTDELVWTESEDGLVLDGAVIRPTAAPRPVAVVLVHGFTARFSHPVYVGLGRALAGRGYVSVTGNNRGWAFGATARRATGDAAGSGERLMIGGAWEGSRSRRATWGRGWPSRPGSDSTGSCCSGTAAARARSPTTRGSARTRASRRWSSPRPGLVEPDARDPDLLAVAERMVSDGRGRELLPWQGDGPPVSAQTYLINARPEHDPYGADNPEPLIARIRCPVLAFYGTREAEGMDALEDIRRAAGPEVRLETTLIEGADHVYTERTREVAAVIADWLDAVL